MFDDIKNDKGGGSASEESVTSNPPPKQAEPESKDITAGVDSPIGEGLINDTLEAPTVPPKGPSVVSDTPGLNPSVTPSTPPEVPLTAAMGTPEGGSTEMNAPQAKETPATNNEIKTPTPGLAEDIFEKTEGLIPQKGPKPEVLQPVAKTQLPQIDRVEVADSGGSNKKVLLIIILVILLAMLGYGSYWVYANIFSGSGEVEQTIETEPINNTEEPVENDNSVPKPEIKPLPPRNNTSLDSDQDGLLDTEEKSLGTDVNRVDSDNDGLYDREEVKVYKTDPLNPDTDGDGYTDGGEVDANYNPLGPGKLYKIE